MSVLVASSSNVWDQVGHVRYLYTMILYNDCDIQTLCLTDSYICILEDS